MPTQIVSLDGGWRFHRGDIPAEPKRSHGDFYLRDLAKTGAFGGAAARDFDDSAWRVVQVPHDWVIEDEFSPRADVTGGYRETGVAWYRREFFIAAADEGRRLLLVFDGMFRDSRVYLNNHRLGGEESGYIPVVFDITDQALYGERNLIAVRLDASEHEGWWYEGGGICRHVRLINSPSLHFKLHGVSIRPEVETRDGAAVGAATIQIDVTVVNDGDVPRDGRVTLEILDSPGGSVGRGSGNFSLTPWSETQIGFALEIPAPRLWSVSEPWLYTLEAAIVVDDGETEERHCEKFGVRNAVFDVKRGFLLNGVPLKIHGVCNHHDHAGVGVAIPDRLHDFRIARMREAGCNAWRCAHHPPAPEFLDACDRLGMLVMDETRCMNTTPTGIQQLETMIRRDRNHPSVVIWCLGNEEVHHQGTATGARIIHTMKRIARRLDPTRPVTLAMNGKWGAPLTADLDVQGINYGSSLEFVGKSA